MKLNVQLIFLAVTTFKATCIGGQDYDSENSTADNLAGLDSSGGFVEDTFLRQQGGKTNKIILYNNCGQKVWVGIQPNGIRGLEIPEKGGFVLEPGKPKTVGLSKSWEGRVWGRQGCNDRGQNCDSGNCFDIGTECNGAGTESVTLAEFRFNGDNGNTFYDISIVDGYTLPITMSPTQGTFKDGQHQKGRRVCKLSKCATPTIITECPDDLPQVNKGKRVGCHTDCDKARSEWTKTGSPAQGNTAERYHRYCCVANTIYDRNRCEDVKCTKCKAGQACKLCPGGETAHLNFFKQRCPDAYVYPNDDVGDTSGQLSCYPKVVGIASLDITFCG